MTKDDLDFVIRNAQFRNTLLDIVAMFAGKNRLPWVSPEAKKILRERVLSEPGRGTSPEFKKAWEETEAIIPFLPIPPGKKVIKVTSAYYGSHPEREGDKEKFFLVPEDFLVEILPRIQHGSWGSNEWEKVVALLPPGTLVGDEGDKNWTSMEEMFS